MPEGIQNPLRWLTKFLTDPGKGLKDANTDFPTQEVVQMQLYQRYMARQYEIKEAGEFADDFAVGMWSFKRKARMEAVAGIYGQREERTPMIPESLEDVTVRAPDTARDKK